MKFVGRKFVLFVLVPIMIGLLIFGIIVFRHVNNTMANQTRRTGVKVTPSATDIVEDIMNALK